MTELKMATKENRSLDVLLSEGGLFREDWDVGQMAQSVGAEAVPRSSWFNLVFSNRDQAGTAVGGRGMGRFMSSAEKPETSVGLMILCWTFFQI